MYFGYEKTENPFYLVPSVAGYLEHIKTDRYICFNFARLVKYRKGFCGRATPFAFIGRNIRVGQRRIYPSQLKLPFLYSLLWTHEVSRDC